jgi:3-oxoacyl-[acyl-carrier protein] reductase
MRASSLTLAGKMAVVVGARRGIGKDIALTLADAGANVAVCDLNIEDGELTSVAEEIRKRGHESLAVKVDVCRKDDAENMVKQIVGKFGRIDILVNTAAIITRTPLYQCEEGNWDAVMDVIAKGYFLISQAVSRQMIEQKQGNIISISGVGGISPLRNTGAYPIAKAAVIMITKQLAWELAEYNIRVNDICPWMTNTPISETPRTLREKEILAGIPLGRMGEAADISNAALFLASDASSWITGHSIVLDGGHMLVCHDITR